MRSTIYINSILLNQLENASVVLDLSKDKLVSVLLTRIINNNNLKAKPYRMIQYQDSYPDIVWNRLHVRYEPVFYEKAQDLRRNLKFSVSWLISFAIVNYLDEVIKKLLDSKNQNNIMDNYDRNFVYIAKMYGKVPVFITMLGLPEKKYLEQLIN